jgi:flagellar biosynthesis/type III secretory pathway M-ring protein FliF/YscJ|tara:strand:- start:772 stop:2088 length:1317 start_codon:yes stop_codon:yes gene_type:complete
MKLFYNFSLIRLFFKLTFFVSIFFVFVLSSCTTEETVEPVAELPVKKKVLFNQRTDGGKNSVTVIEETQGNKRILRIVLQRGDLQSNLIHPIDSPNFVIAVPLQDATSKRLSLKTAAFEQSLKLDLDQLLSRYLSPERFNVSVIINWDQKLLQEVQLKNLPLEADATKADTSDDDTDLSESTKRNHELKEALKSVQVSVLLDNTLPETQEQFLKRLIPAQEFYLADRGDTVTVERTSFPKPFSDSIAPYEEQIVRRKLTELLLKYVAKTDFVVNVKFSLIESNEETTNAPPSASNIKMEINLLLDETVLPTVDTFLKEAIPLAINFDQKRGDTLAIIRKDFPERSDSSLSPEQRGALKDYRAKILEAFQTGDYVAGLEWAAKGLKVAVKRSDKIFILKMKGSLHFLLEEKEEALEMWQHVQRLDPKDEEVRQMLDNLE